MHSHLKQQEASQDMVFARPPRQCWDVLLSLQLLGFVRVKKSLMKLGHLLWTGRDWDESEEVVYSLKKGRHMEKRSDPFSRGYAVGVREGQFSWTDEQLP